jgi:hypothetical protein
MHRTIVSAALALALLPGALAAQEKLAWKFKEGEKFYLEEKTTIKQTIKVLGNDEEKEEEQLNLVSFLVKKKTADGVVLVQTIEKLKSETKRGKEDPNTQQILEKMTGHQFTITLNNQGKITKFEGYNSLIEKISDNNPDVEKVLRAILPVDFFKKTSESQFSMLPDKAVAKGDAWQREMNMSMGPIGGFKIVHTFKHEGEEKGLTAIGSSAKLDYIVPKDDGGLPFKITKGKMQAETAKGRLLFDNKLGRLDRDNTTIVLRGAMTIEIMNMEIDMEMHMEQTTVTRVLATKPGEK